MTAFIVGELGAAGGKRPGCPPTDRGLPCSLSLSDDDARRSFLYGTGRLRFRTDGISKVFGYVVDSGVARSSWVCRKKKREEGATMPQYAILTYSPADPMALTPDYAELLERYPAQVEELGGQIVTEVRKV